MKAVDIDWTELDVKNRDAAAWEAILGWKNYANIDVMHLGLDWSELTRWFLWDKIGRAIRSKVAPEKFRFEVEAVEHRQRVAPIRHSRNGLKRSFVNVIWSIKEKSEGRRYSQYINRFKGRLDSKHPSVFMPFPSERLGLVAGSLIADETIDAITHRTDLASFKGSHLIDSFSTDQEKDVRFCQNLVDSIVFGLAKYSIALMDFDVWLLEQQILKQRRHVAIVETELSALCPDALFVHGDNHSPYQEYVAVANREGIPTITFQHGLDCERYYLDDLFVSHMATWSQGRKSKYDKYSKKKAYIEVTGNPDYQEVDLPKEINLRGDYILWVTRPHLSRRCYSPSRYPDECLSILHALLSFLMESPSQQLIIKPHPDDLLEAYQKYINDSPAYERVRVDNSHLSDLVPLAQVVVTEDSTAGLDAMFHGKPLVHAHFAESDPIMPFVSFGAALPGFSKEMLVDSLRKVKTLTPVELQRMLKGQLDFIRQFAGPLDGQGAMRVASFIINVASQNHSGG